MFSDVSRSFRILLQQGRILLRLQAEAGHEPCLCMTGCDIRLLDAEAADCAQS